MAKNSAINLDVDVNADGFAISGGTTSRQLTVTGGDVTLSGAGSDTFTMPDSSDTLVGRASTDTLTNKTIDANGTGNSISNIDVEDLANGTDGELITWDASGNPATVAVGTSGHVLTSNGAGAAPTFQAAAGGGGSTYTINNLYIDQSGGTSDTYGALSGTINGANTTFTVSESEYATGTLKVYLNGQLQIQGTSEDWDETTPGSGTFDFNTAPESGDEVTVEYSKSNSGAIPYIKAMSVESPTSSEDLTMFFTDDAITVTQMNAVLRGSSTPSVTWTIRHNSDRNATGAEVVTSGTTTTSTTTGSEVTSFNDETIPAGSWVWLETTAQSGTVDELNVTIEYTRD